MTGIEAAHMLESFADRRQSFAELSAVLRPDLAGLFAQMAAGARDMGELAGLMKQFPDQSVASVVRGIAETMKKDRLSVPRLVQRIHEARANAADDRAPLWQDLNAMPTADLKSLTSALGGKPASSKADNLDLLKRYLAGEPLPVTAKKAKSDLSAEIDEAYRQYCQIRDNIGSLSIGEIRAQFEPIARQPKKVLDGLATKLNRRYPGATKEKLVNQLRGTLEDIKGTRMTEALIDSA